MRSQQGRWGLLSMMRLTKNLSGCGLLCVHIDTCTQDFWSASEVGASCQQRYVSVFRQRVAVASAMLYKGPELKLGGPEQTERGSDWDRGQSRECGGSEIRQWRSALSFYITCTAP